MPRHSHQDALDVKEYESLIDAAAELDEPFDAEAEFILVCGGRLGLRAGEIAHMRESWIDWDRLMIEIPRYEPCDKGETGGACGYCRKQAEQEVGYADNLDFEEAIEGRWKPKTPTSARAVPFDFDERVEAVVRAFFQDRDEYPHSRISVNRRVTRVALEAGIDPGRTYPHCLRATAATYHAYRGLTAVPLQSLMGWRKLSTAEKYIRLSGGATADALRKIHSDSS